jgi:MSHA biogenesis protein MshI
LTAGRRSATLATLINKGTGVFRLKTKQRANRLCALAVENDGVAVACIDHGNSGKPLLEFCAFYPLENGQDAADIVKTTASEYQLDKVSCTTLLAGEDYHLLMVEAPEVPPAELRAAIRWRVRDLIDFHIDDAVLDVFDVPPSGARGVQEHLYVVVSRAATVSEHASRLERAGVNLEVIDIPEMALRNIAARLSTDSGGQATLHFGTDRGLITLTRDATLYLARTMEFGWQQLERSPELIDRLALELQRSMDYYDRHFQQAPVTRLTLCPGLNNDAQVSEQLAQQTGVRIQALQLTELVELPAAADAATLARCTLAIGAALRTEPAQL